VQQAEEERKRVKEEKQRLEAEEKKKLRRWRRLTKPSCRRRSIGRIRGSRRLLRLQRMMRRWKRSQAAQIKK
jgi:hypothetical protein